MKKLVSLLLALLMAATATAAAAEAAQWTCPGCGAVNDGNFCMDCGTKRPEDVVCPDCGAIYPVDTPYQFCMECGAKLRPDAGQPAAEPLAVDPEKGRFATPEEAALRYLQGLRERDLDMMLSATDWETLESHRTLENTIARMKSYSIAYTPCLPRDGGLLSALNAEQFRATTASMIRRAVLNYLVSGPEGENTLSSAATGYVVTVDEADIGDFIAQFDLSRLDALAGLSDMEFIAPEIITDKYLLDGNQKNVERTRIFYGADELRDLCVTFMIGGRQYAFCPGFARYGDVWTMYAPGGILAAMLGISMDRQAFAAVDELL